MLRGFLSPKLHVWVKTASCFENKSFLLKFVHNRPRVWILMMQNFNLNQQYLRYEFGWYNLEMDAWVNHEMDAWVNLNAAINPITKLEQMLNLVCICLKVESAWIKHERYLGIYITFSCKWFLWLGSIRFYLYVILYQVEKDTWSNFCFFECRLVHIPYYVAV